MKKQLTTILLLLICFSSFAQIAFEKGYYINNSGQKIEGLIRNSDWLDNPTTIKFKVTESSEIQTLTIQNVKEFRVYKYSKYQRHTIDIDRSGDLYNSLSSNRNPIFKNETLFLKIEVDGDAILYSYTDGNLTRFFFKTQFSDVKQLIYKRYYASASQIGKNNQYQQQLWNNLKCSSVSIKNLERLDYKTSKLTGFFNKYNSCKNPEFSIKKSDTESSFNINIRPGVSFSSLTVVREAIFNNLNYIVSATGYRFGAEFEFIMKFNRGKWALLFEPTYQAFNVNNISIGNNLNNQTTSNIDLEYTSIRVPLGIRHYMFLNKESKIFINALLSIKFGLGGLKVNRSSTGNLLTELEKKLHSFNFGLGYKYKKYSIEARYDYIRSVPNQGFVYQNKMVSLILGYKIF